MDNSYISKKELEQMDMQRKLSESFAKNGSFDLRGLEKFMEQNTDIYK